jgi:CheY-like chemotaxis protein
MILYAAADLLWASKIKGTADALGVAARPVRTFEMLDARLAEGGVRALVVDLDKGDDALALIRRVREDAREHVRTIRVLAWGPHVAKDLLQQARDAGADDVLTRGAFDHSMDDILLRLAGRAG